MKKFLLLSFALLLGIAVVAQKATLRSDIPSLKADKSQKIMTEPVRGFMNPPRVTPNANGDSPSIVTCIEIGTSANSYGNGYAGGQKNHCLGR